MTNGITESNPGWKPHNLSSGQTKPNDIKRNVSKVFLKVAVCSEIGWNGGGYDLDAA
jgi:hypothetical protein